MNSELSGVVAREIMRRDVDLVRDQMGRDYASVDEDVPICDVAALLSERNLLRVRVTRDGELTGVIDAMDIVRLVADQGKPEFPVSPPRSARRTARSGTGKRRASSSRAVHRRPARNSR